ncbi:MAG: hypothetical protein P0Y53_05925 [Candidatus Pseudobacter hemicellulosilyticus]|uniref:YtxH domain-containing protein n=1 Tax=Candidatus Pseudobacter hemicellulosilyticus TaxID=3121375 RepID=A0AAJ5WVQ0_9BACT|nr:MAG: hypothetical protein P0Y53_05925 [Pseudobacter sp.]
MKNTWLTAVVAGAAVAGVFLWMRNRNRTASIAHDVADAAGETHEKIRKYIRKANREARKEMNHASDAL